MKQDLKGKVCTNFQITFLHIVRWTPIGKASGQVDIFVRSLGQADLWSDGPPMAETSCGKVCYYFSQVDLLSDVPPTLRLWVRLTFLSNLWVRLTFGSDELPWQRHLVPKCVTTSVRLISCQMYPLAETSCGQAYYYFGQVDLWSDVPPAETSCGQVCYYFSQVDLWSDMPPEDEALGQVDI